MKYFLIPALLLSACTSTVVRDVPTEVLVPTYIPCVKNKPVELKPLRDRFTKQQWDALTTDQREKLIVAQGLNRKAFGDELTVATAGCLG